MEHVKPAVSWQNSRKAVCCNNCKL